MNINEIIILSLCIVFCVVIASHRIGALWLRIGLIMTLLTIIIRRVDVLSNFYLGYDLISSDVNYLVTYIAVGSMMAMFVVAYRRKTYLMHADQERKADERLKRNAALLADHEKRMAQIVGDDYAFESYEHSAELNRQIAEALK